MTLPTNPLHDDYLFLAPLIRERVAAQVPGLPVEGVAELAQIVDSQDQRPQVAFVLWSGDRFPDTAMGGEATVLFQQWDVWLRVRNASPTNLDAHQETAGPLLSRVHKALAGWKPPGTWRAGMRRTVGPRPNYQRVSGLFPLTFEIPLNL